MGKPRFRLHARAGFSHISLFPQPFFHFAAQEQLGATAGLDRVEFVSADQVVDVLSAALQQVTGFCRCDDTLCHKRLEVLSGEGNFLPGAVKKLFGKLQSFSPLNTITTWLYGDSIKNVSVPKYGCKGANVLKQRDGIYIANHSIAEENEKVKVREGENIFDGFGKAAQNLFRELRLSNFRQVIFVLSAATVRQHQKGKFVIEF